MITIFRRFNAPHDGSTAEVATPPTPAPALARVRLGSPASDFRLRAPCGHNYFDGPVGLGVGRSSDNTAPGIGFARNTLQERGSCHSPFPIWPSTATAPTRCAFTQKYSTASSIC